MNTNSPSSVASGSLPVILQCRVCLRYVCAGEVVALSLGEAAAAARSDRLQHDVCGLPDCAEVAAANLARSAEREKRELKRSIAADAAHRARREGKLACRSAKTLLARQAVPARNREPARLPYHDDADVEPVAVPPAMPLTQGIVLPELGEGPNASSLDQQGFEASGKADTANLKLREFFDHLVATGQIGTWHSRKFLKEVCGNDYINNRVDDLRPHYAERGIKVVNGEVAPNAETPKSSHYRLLLMSDAEVEEFRRTQEPPLK